MSEIGIATTPDPDSILKALHREARASQAFLNACDAATRAEERVEDAYAAKDRAEGLGAAAEAERQIDHACDTYANALTGRWIREHALRRSEELSNDMLQRWRDLRQSCRAE